MDLTTILLIAALVAFLLATFGISAFGLHLGWLGAALITLTLVLGTLKGLSMTLLLILVIVLIVVLLLVLLRRGAPAHAKE